MAAILEARGLRKEIEARTLLDIEELAVERGQVLSVLGPSGAGKSMLLRLLNLLEPPTAGTIHFDGEAVHDLTRSRRVTVARRMAMIFQEPLLFKGTVGRNVEYGLRIRGVERAEREGKVRQALTAVKLGGIEERDSATLSGGEAQRVSLARSLVLEPELLLLDEPFASLDPINRRALQEDVLSLIKSRGITAVFVTHDLGEAALLGDRIAVLDRGSIDQQGTSTEIFYSPASEFVARFVGVENIFDGTVKSSAGGISLIDVEGREVEVVGDLLAGGTVRLGLRPEDITLVPPGGVSSPASTRNALTGEVLAIVEHGATARVTLACPFRLNVIITRRSLADLGIAVGGKAGVRFKATAVILM